MLEFILPCQDPLHPKIRDLLVNRYLFSTWLCYLVEYPLLACFLLYLRFEFFHPIDSIMEILDWLLMSLYTLIRMQLLSIHVIFYGLLQWQIHERPPTCHSSLKELPQKLRLLLVLVSFGYCTSWLYLSFLHELNIDVDVSYTGHYLCLYGAICGFSYFLTEHLCFMEQMDDVPVRSLCRHLFGCIGFTSVLVVLYWPDMADDYSARWQLISLYGCLTTLISAKLHVIRWIHGLVMHRQLPLSLQWDRGVLPMALALGVDCELFGFQMQVARDFHEIVSVSCSKDCPLFQLQGFVRMRPKNWEALRDVLLYRMRQFSEQLRNCPNRPKCQVKSDQSVKRGMRPLVLPTRTPRFWSLRGDNRQPPCRPLQTRKSLQQQLQPMIGLFGNIKKKCSSASPDQVQPELCCGRPLIWLIDGLVCICVRSLEEDRFGSVQCDLEPIFQCLVDLDEMIQLELERHPQPCETLKLLSLSVQRSLKKLILNFHRYLNDVVLNCDLLLKLEDYYRKLTATELY